MKKRDDPSCLHRRTFLKAASGFAGGALLGGVPFGAFAQAQALAPAERAFLFVYFEGGWDQLLALDPRDPVDFTPDRVAETRILPGYDLIGDPTYPTRPIRPAGSNIAFGPAVDRFANHYDKMALVRGINMRTVAHDVGYRYFLTGKEPIGASARGSSMATEVVGQMAPAVPIPSIAYRIESYNDRYPGNASALKVSADRDLLLTLGPSTAIDSEIDKLLVDFRAPGPTCAASQYDTRGLVTSYGTSRQQVRTVQALGLDRSFRFQAASAENDLIRAQYHLPDIGDALFYEQQAFPVVASARAAMAATAIKKGISQCVSFTIVGGLDTHFGTPKAHADRLRAGFNALADLIDDLRKSNHPTLPGKKWLDVTTVVVFSEFARTPLLNATNGRDHHLTSSCALIGAGIKHNTVVGRSGDIGMAPGLINLTTGQAEPGGFPLAPEEIMATVMASAKLDYSISRTEPVKALLAG
jgi:uncharacterized protein (DUF1501 family)